MKHSAPAKKKRKKSDRFDDPFPVKLDIPTGKVVQTIQENTSMTKSEILRRAVRYAAPKFLTGEVDISKVSEPPFEKGGSR